ncbi:MAG: LytR C-terminal domain-containing protein [Candidatus Levyibacteriota bacterium]
MKITFKRPSSIHKTGAKKEENAPSHFSKKEHSPLYFLLYFLLIVGICIGIAVLARIFFLVSKSTFSTASYSVLIVSQNPFIVSLDTTSPKLNLVTVASPIQKNRIKESLSLGIPIDGEILASSQNLSKDSFPDVMLAVNMMFRPWLYSHQDMTIIDALRLVYASFSVSQSTGTSSYTIQRSKTGDILGVSSSQLYDIFKDPVIINEQVSIEIVNATSVQGLAGSAAQVLKNAGCNVISVTSGDIENFSMIVANSSSVTLTRVSHVLGIPFKIDPSFHGITDMRIVLGQDFGNKAQ